MGIELMAEEKLTLNHVNGPATLEGLKSSGSLSAPAIECILGHGISHLDKDDIRKGIGYYHFNRISAGTMAGAPNFNLDKYSDVMFFIDPQVLLNHHFIICKGNVARSSKADAPGKLDSMMKSDEALTEALRAV